MLSGESVPGLQPLLMTLLTLPMNKIFEFIKVFSLLFCYILMTLLSFENAYSSKVGEDG